MLVQPCEPRSDPDGRRKQGYPRTQLARRAAARSCSAIWPTVTVGTASSGEIPSILAIYISRDGAFSGLITKSVSQGTNALPFAMVWCVHVAYAGPKDGQGSGNDGSVPQDRG